MSALQVIINVSIILLIFNILLAIVVVFFESRKPANTWAWLMVLLFIPVLGFIIYLFFGQDGRKQQIFMSKNKNDDIMFNDYLQKKPIIKYEIDNQKKLFKQKISILKKNGQKDLESKNFEDLANMHLVSNNIRVTYNNDIELFHDGKDKFESLINDIKKAKKFIHLEYYIVKDDELGKRLVNELTKKAKEGIEIKFLCDGMGGRGIHKDFFKDFEKAGGEVGVYLKPLAGRLNVRLNYRNHRKIGVIDGEIGYIGGFNVGVEYLGLSEKFGYWRDTHAKVTGDCLDQLELRFIMDWNFASNNKIIFNNSYFPERKNKNGISTQIVSSGPDCKFHQIKNGYFKLINEAEKSIYITTPYFIPDDGIYQAIKVAALAGLDVRVLIPGKPDHPFVYWANLSYAGELLGAGVKFYHYDKNSFVHSKVLMVDSKVCSLGTANMDVRSFQVNFEVNAFIYDKKITMELENEFLKDLKSSKQLFEQDYNRRSIKVKFYESVSRLISPML